VARCQWRSGARGGGGVAGALWEEGGGENSAWGGWLGLPGRSRPGGLARPAWPLGARWAGSASGPIGPKLKKISFPIKIEFLNLPRLWKFVEGDLGGILS
jgi:hypothetical protein